MCVPPSSSLSHSEEVGAGQELSGHRWRRRMFENDTMLWVLAGLGQQGILEYYFILFYFIFLFLMQRLCMEQGQREKWKCIRTHAACTTCSLSRIADNIEGCALLGSCCTYVCHPDSDIRFDMLESFGKMLLMRGEYGVDSSVDW